MYTGGSTEGTSIETRFTLQKWEFQWLDK